MSHTLPGRLGGTPASAHAPTACLSSHADLNTLFLCWVNTPVLDFTSTRTPLPGSLRDECTRVSADANTLRRVETRALIYMFMDEDEPQRLHLFWKLCVLKQKHSREPDCWLLGKKVWSQADDAHTSCIRTLSVWTVSQYVYSHKVVPEQKHFTHKVLTN